jgi:hypothetical protein
MADHGYINTLTSVSAEDTRSVLAHNAALSLLTNYAGGRVTSPDDAADKYVELFKKIHLGLA